MVSCESIDIENWVLSKIRLIYTHKKNEGSRTLKVLESFNSLM